MPARTRRPARLAHAAEVCEPRRLLTTFTVTDGGDVTDAGDGVLTYREALLAAEAEAGADIITFADGVGGVILEADLPELTGDLTVVADAAGVTIDHAGFGGLRLAGGDFAFSDVTFVGAARDAGAALDVFGGATLTVTGGAFAGNTATDDGGEFPRFRPDAGGGAVRVAGATATFTGVTFDGNTAARGGAVLASAGSDLTFTDVRAVRNAAEDRFRGWGGFLFVAGGADSDDPAPVTVTVAGGYFALNTAGKDGGAISFNADGGTPFLTAGGGTLAVSGATFSSNVAGVEDLGTNSGGAIDMVGSDWDTTVTDVLFFRNRVVGAREATGGALTIANGTFTVADSTFARNEAASEGGAFHAVRLGVSDPVGSFTNVRFVGNAAGVEGGAGSVKSGGVVVTGGHVAQNRAGVAGGAFFVEGGRLSLNDLSANRNRVTGEAEPAGSLAARGGGAVAVLSGNFTRGGRLEATGVRMFRNRVAGAGGGAISASSGAAGGNVTLTDVSLTANTADGPGGGVQAFGGVLEMTDTFVRKNRSGAEGGGVWAAGFRASREDFDAVVRMTGGGIFENAAANVGGGLWAGRSGRADAEAAVRLDGVAVRDNAARGGGGAFVGERARAVVRADSLFRGNAAEETGGAARVRGELRIRDTRVLRNDADAGGAVFTDDDGRTVLLADALFRGNGPDPFAGPGRLNDRR